MTSKPARANPHVESAYGIVLNDIAGLIAAARSAAARSVNCIMTATYWLIGRRIVEFEQGGETRAQYGEELLKRLSTDLSARFGRGFGVDNLQRFRAFYLAYPAVGKYATPSRISADGDVSEKHAALSRKSGIPSPSRADDILRTLSAESSVPAHTPSGSAIQTVSGALAVSDIARHFPLPWSAYVRCAYKDEAVARYALARLPNKVLAAEYRTALPDEKELAAEIERTRAALERRRISPQRHRDGTE